MADDSSRLIARQPDHLGRPGLRRHRCPNRPPPISRSASTATSPPSKRKTRSSGACSRSISTPAKCSGTSSASRAFPKSNATPKPLIATHLSATDGQSIAAIFGSEGLFCFDTTGKKLWHKDLGPMNAAFFRAPAAQWGFASSPIIHGGKVIVLCDVMTNSFPGGFQSRRRPGTLARRSPGCSDVGHSHRR